jgi:hypothetical protein
MAFHRKPVFGIKNTHKTTQRAFRRKGVSEALGSSRDPGASPLLPKGAHVGARAFRTKMVPLQIEPFVPVRLFHLHCPVVSIPGKGFFFGSFSMMTLEASSEIVMEASAADMYCIVCTSRFML